MKKLATLIIVAIMGVVLINCGGKLIKGASTISGAGTTAYQSFDDVHGIIKDNISAFSPRDVVRLRAASEILSNAKAEVYVLMIERGSALEMANDLPDLIPLYEKARTAFVTASNIVMDEIDEFDREDQIILYSFQNTCSELNVAITEALNSIAEERAQNVQLVRDIMTFVILVGKIAIPLIIL